MKRPGSKFERIIKIAKRLEEQQSDCRKSTELQSVIEELKPDEIAELKQFEKGLNFINVVRDRMRTSDRSDFQSTINTEDHDTHDDLETSIDFSYLRFLDQEQQSKNGKSKSGKSIGRFEVIKEIGKGGFAKVFLAYDPDLRRNVAVKVPKPFLIASEESRIRFDREARSAALLNHPAIVPVFESSSSGPISFIAYEYCPGETLCSWIAEKIDEPVYNADVREAAKIIARLADAVEHSHQRGVIHRDLKPSNILIDQNQTLPTDSTSSKPIWNKVRITDFGLSKKIVESPNENLTTEGAIVGTPAYMSPEQASGQTSIGPETDIFSLGIMLYQLLTGRLPFKRDDNISTLTAVCTDHPTEAHKIRRSVPRDLSAIASKCLEKDPTQRYSTAFDLAEDLHAWLGGRTVTARRSTFVNRTIRWVKQEPKLAATITFAFASLILGMSLTAWQASVAKHNLQISNVQKQRAEKNLDRLHDTVKSILDKYAANLEKNPVLEEPHRGILEQMIDVHRELISEEAKEIAVTKNTLKSYSRIVGIYRQLGEYQKAHEICDQGKSLYDLAISNDPSAKDSLLSAYLYLDGQKICLMLDTGDWRDAIELGNKVCALAQDTKGTQSNQRYLSQMYYHYRHLGIAQLPLRDGKAANSFHQSFQYAKKLYELDPTKESNQATFARSFQDISNVERNWNKKIKLLESSVSHYQALTDDEEITTDYRYRLAYLHSEIASGKSRKKEFDAAIALIENAHETMGVLVNEQPRNAIFRDRHGVIAVKYLKILEDANRDLEAVEKYPQLFAVVENTFAPERRAKYIGMALREHFSVLMRLGKKAPEYNALAEQTLDEAIQHGEAAIIEYARLENIHSMLCDAYRVRGIVESRVTEDFRNAYPMAQRSTDISLLMQERFPSKNNSSLVLNRMRYEIKIEAASGSLSDISRAKQFVELIENTDYGHLHAATIYARRIDGLRRLKSVPATIEQENKMMQQHIDRLESFSPAKEWFDREMQGTQPAALREELKKRGLID